MKNYYKLTRTLMVLAVIITARLNSQVATLYSFSQLAGTYNAVTGGTVFGSTSSDDESWSNPATPNSSSNTGPGIPIGFSFMYNNHVYDRIAICNNGWITFGQSGLVPSVNISGGYQGISYSSGAPAILQDAIAGLSTDIQGQGGSSIKVATLGSVPTRTCVVQWTNYRKYNNSGDAFDFQIRLCETTNIVEVQFGNLVPNSSGVSAQVGLRGDSNSDFNNRQTSTTNIWSNSIPGTSNTSQVNAQPTLIPTSGQLYRWSPPQCSGSLSSLSATGDHSLVCPNGGVILSLLNTYTTSGIVYAWSTSTSSAVGPFVPVANSNGAAYAAQNITVPTWFVNTAICLNGGIITTTSTSFGVQVAGTTINQIPYFENFEGIVSNNELPNCSWTTNNIANIDQTYIGAQSQNRVAYSGTKFASFYMYYTNGANYFYTNGLQLNAGVTYSANLFYTTESYGYTNVTDLSILYGTTQTPTGLVNIASHSPALSPVYKALGGTFSVPTSGIYYVAVRATGNGNYGAYYLSWDDISVTVPCSLNQATVSLSASSQTICNGESVNLTATGTDTYMWNTGATGAILTDMPSFNTVYTVVGTNTLSGCAATVQSQMVYVNPTPVLGAYAVKPIICSGDLTNLVVNGASSYTWSTASNNPIIAVSPTISTSYIVLGGNSYNCVSTATIDVQVNPLPLVTIASSGPANNEICKGESVTLNGNGALNYSWASNAVFVQSPQAIVSPIVNTTYTVTGVNANGCAGKATIVLNVNECLGISQIATTLSGVKVYPNPTSGLVTIELNTTSPKTVQITDLTGRVVMTSTSNNEKVNVNINNLANGIYYVKIQSDNAVEVIKIVKQ